MKMNMEMKNSNAKLDRSEGQKLIVVAMNENFIEKIDAALLNVGYSTRSRFIQDAIREKLHRDGVEVPITLTVAPLRKKTDGC